MPISRLSRLTSVFGSSTWMPSTISSPPSRGSRRLRQRISVLLPDPLGPAMTIFSPSCTSRLIPRKTCNLPKDLCTFLKLMSGPLGKGGQNLAGEELQRAGGLLEGEAAKEEGAQEVVGSGLAKIGAQAVAGRSGGADQEAAAGELAIEVHAIGVARQAVGLVADHIAMGEVVHEVGEGGP